MYSFLSEMNIRLPRFAVGSKDSLNVSSKLSAGVNGYDDLISF